MTDLPYSPAAKQQIGLEVGFVVYTMFFLWILVPNTIYNKNPMDATLSALSVCLNLHNSKMATPEIVVLEFWSYLNLYMEFLGDLKGWFIQLTLE